MIKKFNEFLKESYRPNEGQDGSVSLTLSDGDVELFQTEGSLRTLITDEKISLVGNDLWYHEDDKQTIDTLSNYFSI
jgi:uncharacterized protein involved in outer membrane biogenesis